MAHEIGIPDYKLRKWRIANDPNSMGGVIMDGGCVIKGFPSTGAVIGNDEIGFFWEAWDFASSDVIYDTYDAAKKELIEYFWLLKDREEG